MRNFTRSLIPFCALSLLVIASCERPDVSPGPETAAARTALPPQQVPGPSALSATNFPETFESGTKTSYAAADVTLTSGSWNLNNALIGTSTSDAKNGTKSVRITASGIVTMNFDTPTGASTVTIQHALYGTDASSTWQLWVSQNAGSTWTQVGSTITSSSTALQGATFTVNLAGSVRFQLRKVSGSGRINVDDFDIQQYSSPTPTRDDNLGMGNPSGAVANISFPDNYLMDKSMYTLSYNRTKEVANWVSWHLSAAWKGTATRSTSFITDQTLPTGWYRVSTNDYTNSGFDRGHMCPSDDRDYTSEENKVTFTMTNIVPQAPNNNQGPWAALEAYCRTLISSNNEMYIISGPSGSGGTGSVGFATVIGNSVAVPAYTWKVVLILPVGSNDASRVTSSTRVIAVKMPNIQTIGSTWGQYRVSVDQLESELGYDFLSAVPTSIQSTIESQVDNGPTQ